MTSNEIDDDFFQFDDDAGSAMSAMDDGPLPVPPRLGLLADLTREEFDAVARSAKLAHVEPGTVVFHQGDPADRFFIVIDGVVRIERDGHVLADLEHSSFFGETALMTGSVRSGTATALLSTSLWSIDFATFQSVLSGQLLRRIDARKEIEARIAMTPVERFSRN